MRRDKQRHEPMTFLKGIILLVGALLLLAHNIIPHHIEEDGCVSLSSTCQTAAEETCCEEETDSFSHCHHHTQQEDHCLLHTLIQKKERRTPDQQTAHSFQRFLYARCMHQLNVDATALHRPPDEQTFYHIKECLNHQRDLLFRACGFRAPPLV